ncbi:putative aldehyde dehydrogenase protein [Neofusicoccum parvum UCRNP2]|uniref:Putative aldehyde dehydrogenase protein n=1 Tax=Botryosphaeria parva (strain UCR-NP2) TaxID=1287680 RepID=R1EBU5_BOTPV|nr:putative aldehyde dehydrogenase protein [Neofusicoccum parvum UCRNP2]
MPPAPGPSASAPPAAKSTGQNVRKKRTAVSCDRCKNRKTKVRAPAPLLDTDGPPLTLRRGAMPGPCQYCASINAPCKTDLNRRKKRPYYHVSEEEYRCMTDILRHYLPDLQFNLPSLKALCARLEGLEGAAAHELPDGCETPATPADDDDDDEAPAAGRESPTIQEIQALQEQLGCLMIDSRGNYRRCPPAPPTRRS